MLEGEIMKNTKRIISIVTALTLALSLFTIMPVAQAVEAVTTTNDTVIEKFKAITAPCYLGFGANSTISVVAQSIVLRTTISSVIFWVQLTAQRQRKYSM